MSDVNDSGTAAVDESPVENTDVDDQTTDEGGEGQEGQKAAAPAKPQPNLRKIKYKADGKEYEDEIDLNDEKTLAKHMSMSKAAYQRMQEAAKTRQQAEQFVKMLQEDPVKLLTHEQFGGSKKFREIAEKFLASQLEDEMLSPEEKRQRTNEERLRKFEDQEKQSKQRQEEEQMQKLQEHYANDFQAKIVKGLSSQGIPKTARTVKRMAELMAKNLQHNLDLEPEHLAELVKQDYVAEMKEMFGQSEGDVLLKLLGEDVANKIRKSDLARLKGSGVPTVRTGARADSGASKDTPPTGMSKEQWKEWIDKRANS